MVLENGLFHGSSCNCCSIVKLEPGLPFESDVCGMPRIGGLEAST